MAIKATKAQIDELVRRGAVVAAAVMLSGPRARGRIHRHEVGRMNKLESAYAAEMLNLRRIGGEVFAFLFESVKLRLADKTWYTPDFMVMLADGTIEFHEVKGFIEDDARVKWKAVAEAYPMFRFLWITRVDGNWKIVEYRG